jgi:hypothetical protein
MKEFKIEVFVTEEQIKEMFEAADIKFSKAKLKKLMSISDDMESEVKEQLEGTWMEMLSEFMSDEWEK